MELFDLSDPPKMEKSKPILTEGVLYIFKTCEDDPWRFKRIMDRGNVDVNMKDSWKNTFLHVAIWKRQSLLEYLIEKGADVNAKNMYGNTPLHWAESRYVIETLLRHGADIHALNNDGYTPLEVACIDYTPEAIRVFYEHGSRIPTMNELPRWSKPKSQYAYQTLSEVIALYAGMCWKRSDVGGIPSTVVVTYLV
jgi:hypothetical protein